MSPWLKSYDAALRRARGGGIRSRQGRLPRFGVALQDRTLHPGTVVARKRAGLGCGRAEAWRLALADRDGDAARRVGEAPDSTLAELCWDITGGCAASSAVRRRVSGALLREGFVLKRNASRASGPMWQRSERRT